MAVLNVEIQELEALLTEQNMVLHRQSSVALPDFLANCRLHERPKELKVVSALYEEDVPATPNPPTKGREELWMAAGDLPQLPYALEVIRAKPISNFPRMKGMQLGGGSRMPKLLKRAAPVLKVRVFRGNIDNPKKVKRVAVED